MLLFSVLVCYIIIPDSVLSNSRYAVVVVLPNTHAQLLSSCDYE